MPLAETILITMGLLSIAMLAAGSCRKLPLPFTVILVLLGMALSALSTQVAGLQALHHFRLTPELVLFLFLPALVFESALNLDARQLLKDLIPVLTLAVPAMLVSGLLVGLGLWWLLGIEPLTALLFGALISATDPVAVVALFKELGAPLRLTVLVEGESLFNDATAIVLFNILLALALAGGAAWSDAGLAIAEFLRVFIGGSLVGIIIGLLIAELMSRLQATGDSALIVLSLVVAYASFIIAEHALHVSGVMAVVAAGICLGGYGSARIPQASSHMIRETWDFIALICNSLLFLLVGLSVNFSALLARADVILLAAVLVIAARAAAVYSLVPITTRLFRLPHVSTGEQHIMWWGGLKGGLAIAIVLSIPEDLTGRQFLVDLTLGVVMLSLLINATTIRPLIRWLGIDRLNEDEHHEYQQGLVRMLTSSREALDRFARSGLISAANRSRIEQTLERQLLRDRQAKPHPKTLRQVYLHALRIESDTLDELHEIGLLRTYAYLDLRNTLKRDRDRWSGVQDRGVENGAGTRQNPFHRLERLLLKRLREHDWAAGLLARYQRQRLGNRLQHDLASILMSQTVIQQLQEQRQQDPAHFDIVIREYDERARHRQQRLRELQAEFPEFYTRFEHELFQRVALASADQYVRHLLHNGEIGAKAYNRLQADLQQALALGRGQAGALERLSAQELLQAVPLFAGLSSAAREKLARLSTQVTFLPGDIIIGEGDHGDALYIITRGQVRVSHEHAGRTEVLAALGQGEFFGETALLGDAVRTATVTASTTTTLLRLKRRQVLQLAGEEAEIDRHLQAAMRTRQTDPGDAPQAT